MLTWFLDFQYENDDPFLLIYMALVPKKWKYKNLHGPGPLPHGKKSSAVG